MDNFASAKRKSGQVLRSKERQIVVNVFNYLKRLSPDKSVTGFDSVTADRWTDCAEHVKRVEAGMWGADEIHDNIKTLIIKIGENSSSSDVSDDSDQGKNSEDIDHYMEGIAPLH
jgi:hypothetical protein